MRRLGVPPLDIWSSTVGERLNVYSGAADPTVAEVPENQWIVYHNTTIPEVRIWTNIAGVLMKSAAFV
jgi:hypothetical protein